MLGRVRRRQVDDNLSLEHARPAFMPHISKFYEVLMVQAQRLHYEHVQGMFLISFGLIHVLSRHEDFDIAKTQSSIHFFQNTSNESRNQIHTPHSVRWSFEFCQPDHFLTSLDLTK
jgi:hypothetical protein